MLMLIWKILLNLFALNTGQAADLQPSNIAKPATPWRQVLRKCKWEVRLIANVVLPYMEGLWLRAAALFGARGPTGESAAVACLFGCTSPSRGFAGRLQNRVSSSHHPVVSLRYLNDRNRRDWKVESKVPARLGGENALSEGIKRVFAKAVVVICWFWEPVRMAAVLGWTSS